MNRGNMFDSYIYAFVTPNIHISNYSLALLSLSLALSRSLCPSLSLSLASICMSPFFSLYQPFSFPSLPISLFLSFFLVCHRFCLSSCPSCGSVGEVLASIFNKSQEQR